MFTATAHTVAPGRDGAAGRPDPGRAEVDPAGGARRPPPAATSGCPGPR